MSSEGMAKWLADAAKYFDARPTDGEDMAHWSNVYNAENCQKIATALVAQEAEIAALRMALGEIALVPRGGLQGIREDYSDEAEYNLHAMHYLARDLERVRGRARAALTRKEG